MSKHGANLWIPLAILAGAGLLLWSDAKASAESENVLSARFDADLAGYKAATANIAPALDPALIAHAFNDGDVRERASVMTWLARRASGKTKYTVLSENAQASQEQASNAAMAAAKLAIDLRDKFYEKDSKDGVAANDVLEAIKLESEGKKSLRDVSNALIALVTDMAEIGSASTPIDKDVSVLVNFTPEVTAVVQTSPEFYLEGYDSNLGSPRASYLAKIVDRKNTPYKGEYLIITAPIAKTNA